MTKASHECIGSGSIAIAPALDRGLSDQDRIIGTIPQMNDPAEAGLLPFDEFVAALNRTGLTSGSEGVTKEIQVKSKTS